jgi:signal transduction histidine kinase
MNNRDTLVVSDLAQDPYLSKLKKEEYLQKAFISAPLIYKDEVLGVLHVCDKKTPGPFTQREVSVVMNIVRMGAITLQNARLYEQTSKRAAELKIAYDELKEMQNKLIQSEKLKAIGQLASGVAHEMRNPIGIIMQGVAYLEQIVSPEAKESRETLSILKESAQRADGIVISLLDFSRATKLELHPENIDSILENSLNLVKTELRNIKVIREIQEDLPKVLVDKNKLMQVFINLFMNAIHAMPEGGKLTIRNFVKQLEEAGDSIGKRSGDSFEAGEEAVVVEVEDTGTGISEENLKRIFDPFFTTKGRGKGTGLGLSVSQNIIIMHKGLIEVRSQVNKGTRVIITLKIFKEEGANG